MRNYYCIFLIDYVLSRILFSILVLQLASVIGYYSLSALLEPKFDYSSGWDPASVGNIESHRDMN